MCVFAKFSNKIVSSSGFGILDETGYPCSSVKREKEVFRARWRQLFAGEVASISELLEQDNQFRQNSQTSFRFSLDVLPTFSQYVGLFAHAKKFKGLSEDLIGTEVFALAPTEMAKIFHPIAMKSAALIQYPLQWRGGFLFELYKGKGEHSQIANYRDVTIADHPSKALNSTIRANVFEFSNSFSTKTQFGSGFNDGSCDAARVVLDSISTVAKELKLCGVFIFTDVVTAFATFMREVLLPDFTSRPNVFLDRLVYLGFSRDVAQRILDEFRECNPWKDGIEEHAYHLVAEAHRMSWTSTEYLEGVLVSAIGVLAGTPLADLLFSVKMALLIKDIRKQLEQIGLLFNFSRASHLFCDFISRPDFNEFDFHDVSYMDDVVFALLVLADVLMAAVEDALKIIDTTFRKFGFEVNYGKGKTELVIRFNGKGSHSLKKYILHELGAKMSFVTLTGAVQQVRVVNAYKHLGAKYGNGDSHLPEIKARFMSARSALKPETKRFIKNPNICEQTFLFTVQLYMFSRCLYLSGSWPTLGRAETKEMHHQTMFFYRLLLQQDFTQDRIFDSDVAVLNRLQAPAPKVLLTVRRLTLFFRFCKNNMSAILQLCALTLGDDKSWINAVLNDTRFLQNLFQPFFIFRDLNDRDALCKMVEQHKKLFNSLSTFLKTSEARDPVCWAVNAVDRELLHIHRCEMCNKNFESAKSLSCHNFQVHHVRNPVRQFVDSSCCPICLTEFWSIERLIRHLSIRKDCPFNKCRTIMLLFFSPLTHEQISKIDEDALRESKKLKHQGRRETFADLPATAAEGPRIKVASIFDE